MSCDRLDAAERTFEEFGVTAHSVDGRYGFGAHRHPEHQLAWMRHGTMELEVPGARWHLTPEHMAWIPSGVPHEMTLLSAGTMISAYPAQELRPAGPTWLHPMVLSASRLLRELMVHLVDQAISDRRRALCQVLLYDLLEQSEERHDVLSLPRDPRAQAVARGILEHPADQRGLEMWSADLGVSTKTLTRAFMADTGGTFSQWRTRARLNASLPALARHEDVATVARSVGYATTSGYITAFRGAFGTTPARYVRGR